MAENQGGMRKGLGSTSLRKPEPSDSEVLKIQCSNSGALEDKKEEKEADEKPIFQKGVKFTKTQCEQLELIKLTIPTTLDSDALRYCFNEFWKVNKEEIERKAKEIKELTKRN